MGTPRNVEVRRYDNRDEFYCGASEIVTDRIESAISERGRCSLALSGGRTPGRLFELLADECEIDWKAVDIFWVDERCVPTDHPDSNFGMAQRALLSRISIPEGNIHGIVTEGHSPSEAADSYQHQLKTFFEDSLPWFDVMLLGMGADGHTASIFPEDDAVYEQDRWVVAVDGKRGTPPVPRVTLTLPVINNSKCILFIVSGESKMRVFEDIVESNNAADYPAGLVHPNGELIWCVFNKDQGPAA